MLARDPDTVKRAARAARQRRIRAASPGAVRAARHHVEYARGQRPSGASSDAAAGVAAIVSTIATGRMTIWLTQLRARWCCAPKARVGRWCVCRAGWASGGGRGKLTSFENLDAP